MKWPLVSRERYEERIQELRALQVALDLERERNLRLWNYLNWRTDGNRFAFDPSLLPDLYQRKPETPTKEQSKAAETLRNVRAPGQARRDLARFEVERQGDFERLHGTAPATAETQESGPAASSSAAD